MIANARYGHTNLIARDWRALSGFYQTVFGCVPVPPERDYSGPELEAGTGVKGASVRRNRVTSCMMALSRIGVSRD